jgi:hypothetical protein
MIIINYHYEDLKICNKDKFIFSIDVKNILKTNCDMNGYSFEIKFGLYCLFSHT